MSNDDHMRMPPKILIVEDEQLVATDVEMQLVSFGYEVAWIAGVRAVCRCLSTPAL